MGVGVGLSICKLICESLGGDIQVYSEPGKGSNFVFCMQVFEHESDVNDGVGSSSSTV